MRPSSGNYDEYEATIRVPKGETLARSRNTPGAYRGFTRHGDRSMEHAEIFLKGESEQTEREANQDPPPVIIIREHAPASRTREQEELQEELRALVELGLNKAWEKALPYVKRWCSEQALPFIKTNCERLRKRRGADNQPASHEPIPVIQAALVEDSEEVVTALEDCEASMTSEEARRHFIEALIAMRVADGKMRLLANARIEDGAVPPELASAFRALTPNRPEDTLNWRLATKPHVLDDLANLLKTGGGEHPPELGSGKIEEALRLTNDDR